MVLPDTALRLLARMTPVAAAPGTALPADVEVWQLLLNDCADLVDDARELLDDADRRAAERYARPAARNRQVLCHAALRCLLARRLGKHPAELRFLLGSHGKPRLDEPAGLHFNLSHSGDGALFALADREVGVDLERMRPRRNLEQLAAVSFSATELAAFLAAPAAERERTFYRLWACKEALLKAWGLGLAAGLARFDVDLAAPPQLTRVAQPLVPAGPWILRELAALPGYAAALAVRDLRSS